MAVLDVGAVWFHTLALLIALGYYGILGRVVVPSLERTLTGADLSAALGAVERRRLLGPVRLRIVAAGSWMRLEHDAAVPPQIRAKRWLREVSGARPGRWRARPVRCRRSSRGRAR